MASGEVKFEEKLFQAIDDTSDKRQQTRIDAYEIICEILNHTYIPASLNNCKTALLSSLERSLRKGKAVERINATKTIPLLMVQRKTAEDVSEMGKILNPILISIIKDFKNVTCSVTVQCCSVLGLLCFVGEEDPVEILTVMRILQEVVQEDLPDSDIGELYAAVLNGWSLLLTLLPPKVIVEQTKKGVLISSRCLIGMLDNTHLNVRTSSSKTLALIHELTHQHDPNFLHDELPDLIDMLQTLSKASNKFQANEDRKQQRFTIRDVLHYLVEGKTPEIRIKFENETLLLDSWTIRHRYSCLSSVLASGMNVQLRENLLVRNILKLGPKASKMEKRFNKILKLEQRLSHEAASKYRSITRGKERDKRSTTLE